MRCPRLLRSPVRHPAIASEPCRVAELPTLPATRRASVRACSGGPNPSGRSAQAGLPVPPSQHKRRASVPACSGESNPPGRSAQAGPPAPPSQHKRRASVPACSGESNPSGRSAQAGPPVPRTTQAGPPVPPSQHKRGRLCYGQTPVPPRASVPACSGPRDKRLV